MLRDELFLIENTEFREAITTALCDCVAYSYIVRTVTQFRGWDEADTETTVNGACLTGAVVAATILYLFYYAAAALCFLENTSKKLSVYI